MSLLLCLIEELERDFPELGAGPGAGNCVSKRPGQLEERKIAHRMHFPLSFF